MMRRPTWRSIAAGVGVTLAAYVLFLVVLAPATLLDGGLQNATGGTLRLAQAHGTLWSGNGRLEVRDKNGQGGVGKDLSWTLQPRALWRGRLDFEVAVDHATGRFPVRISASGIEMSNADFSLPASALGMAVPRIAPLGPRGDLIFHVAKFSAAGDKVSADAVVTWKDAGSALTPIAPLGTYELRLDDAAGYLKATLRTRSGPLRLDGGGSWRGSGPLTFSATARVDARHRPQLAPLLRLIAIERGDGDFALQFNPPLGGGNAAPRSGAP
jgi:general secretion pathway protein N